MNKKKVKEQLIEARKQFHHGYASRSCEDCLDAWNLVDKVINEMEKKNAKTN